MKKTKKYFSLMMAISMIFSQTTLLKAAGTEGKQNEPASGIALVNESAKAAQTAKKAVYVLPGYMGSRLYDSAENELWVNPDALVDDAISYTLPFGETSQLTLNEDGTGSKVHVNGSLDQYGSQDVYQPLMENLKANFGSDYDIVFFPFNWLGDLNESSQLLTQDINAKGYEKVVFVTHSTGGLLAATYIASSRENQLKVEKAILLAPPLFGTYTSLEPIEYGKTGSLESMLVDNGIENDIFGLTYSVIYGWVKAITYSSPTTYQLLPSQEYLQLLPQIYSESYSGKPIVNMSDYYATLNGSSNINSLLTNGNNRSHNYLRSNVFGGDIVKVFQSVDTTIVGCSYGYMTPAIAVYESKLFGGTKIKEIIPSMDGDGTVLNVSAFATKEKDKHVLNYRDFVGYSHGDLANKPDVFAFINGTIRGTAPLNAGQRTAQKAALAEQGMSNFIKLNVTAAQSVDIVIQDSTGKDVASVKGGRPSGFDNVKFNYTSLAGEGEETNATLYLPNTGYKVILSSEDARKELVATEVSTLDKNGFQTAAVTYKTARTDASNEIFKIDMLDKVVNQDNLSFLGKSARQRNRETDVYYTEWTIEENKTLSLDTKTAFIDLSGSDVTSGWIGATDLTWTSSDARIASVSEQGEVTGHNYGKVQIFAAAKDGSNKVLTCNLTVPLAAKAVTFDDVQMVVDERVVLAPVFDSDQVTQNNISYSYDQSANIIYIDSFGVVRALNEGSIEVTGMAEGGAKNTFTVSVEKNNIAE